MPLDLIVPDLLPGAGAPAPMRALRLPQLEKWLARAELSRTGARDPAAWLALEYGIAAPVPVAAIALAGEGPGAPGAGPAGGGAQAWLRADPVHIRVERDGLVVHDAAVLGVTRAEADAILPDLQALFASDGLEFHAPAPERWYVRVPEGELPATTPLADALGRDLFGLLPTGRGRINWRSALTEAQMLLAAHAVNAAREAAGSPQLNSVWFWGEGVAPGALAPRYAAMHAEDAFARGLARASGAAVHPLPARLEALAAGGASPVAAVLDGLTPALRSGALDAWREQAERLDRDWFAGLGQALQRHGTVRIVLPAEAGTRVATLTGSARWRWLKPRRPLSSHA